VIRRPRPNGKRPGQPKRVFRRDEAVRLRADGMSWQHIAAELRVPFPTVLERKPGAGA
jgi:hypothetical protein